MSPKSKRPQGYDLTMSSAKKRRKKQKLRLIWTNIIASLVLVVSIVALAGMSALNMRLLTDSQTGSEPLDSDAPTGDSLGEVQKSEHEDVSYFLVVGTDESDALTDIMMVVCFDHGRDTINIMQLPRDTYIGSDVNTGKLNAVYGSAKKGQSRVNTLIKRINTHLGLPIDHYFLVSLSAFRNIVNAVGGVDIDIPNKLWVSDSQTNEFYYIGPGMTHLNGYQAEGFVRNRSGKGYAKGDMSRVEAQRNFYAAFFKKVTNMSLGQMVSSATSCYDKVKTDLTVGEMLGYVKEIKQVSMDNIKIMAIPGQSGSYKIPGSSVKRSYYSIHKSDYVAILNEHFYPYGGGVTTSDLKVTELHTEKHASDIDPGVNLSELVQ